MKMSSIQSKIECFCCFQVIPVIKDSEFHCEHCRTLYSWKNDVFEVLKYRKNSWRLLLHVLFIISLIVLMFLMYTPVHLKLVGVFLSAVPLFVLLVDFRGNIANGGIPSYISLVHLVPAFLKGRLKRFDTATQIGFYLLIIAWFTGITLLIL